MTKVFKNSRHVLAFVLAFAVLAVSLFTGVVINSDAACDGAISTYATDEPTLSLLDSTQPNSESNPYIIQNANQMYSFLIMNSVNSDGVKICTTGTNYFKVADGIKAFYMNGGETVAAMTTPAQIKEYFEVTNTSAKKIWTSDSDRVFTGHFDGNGVEIYGLRSDDSRGALFTNVSGNVTIKNVTVKNSYLKGSIVGGIIARTANSSEAATVTIENCAVVNNYMVVASNGANAGAASLVAQAYGNNINANNILIYGNGYSNIDGYSYGLVSYGWASGSTFSNIVSIGYAPYRVTDMTTGANASHHYVKNEAFSNVYTDCEAKSQYIYNGSVSNFTYKENEVKQLAVADMQGAAAITNCANLDWENTWLANEGVPALRKFHKTSIVCNNNGTHTEDCADLTGVALNCTYESGKCSVCNYADPDYDPSVSVYSGSLDKELEGSGTKEVPYIIKTADELAAVVLGRIEGATENTYYEVDSSVKSFHMNGGATVAGYTNVSDVITYFEANGGHSWSTSAYFTGHFDGKGATVYGLYCVNTGGYVPSALFPQTQGKSSIKNIALKNSYIKGANIQGATAGIVGSTHYENPAVLDSVDFENIAIINNYIGTTGASESSGASTLAGMFFGADSATVNNVLIYGNTIDNNGGTKPYRTGMINSYNGTNFEGMFNNIVSIGAAPWSLTYKADGTYGHAGWYNSNLDSGKWTNVYTDQSKEPLQAYNPNNSDNNLKKWNINILATEDIAGATADEMSALGTDAWFFNTTTYPQLRVFHDISSTDNEDGTHSESCNCGLVGVAADHVFDKEAADGVCTVCGADCTHGGAVPPAGQWGSFEFKETVAGDCVTPAKGNMVCSLCGMTSPETTDPSGAPGHALNEVTGKEETCTAEGEKTYWHCDVCGNNYEDENGTTKIANVDEWKVIPMKAHTPIEDENGIVYNMDESGHSKTCSECGNPYDKEPHTGDGYEADETGHTGSCSVCKMATSGKADHTFDESGYCPTCTWECKHGGAVPPAGQWGSFEFKETTKGDCQTAAIGNMVCSLCGMTSPETTDPSFVAKDHIEGTPVESDRVEASCTENGSYVKTVSCTECGKEISKTTETITAEGHNFEAVAEVIADCTDKGTKAHNHCTVCEKNFAADADKMSTAELADADLVLEVDPNVHRCEIIEAKEATCTDDGYIKHSRCKKCNLLFNSETGADLSADDVVVKATGHDLEEVKEVAATTEKEGTKAHYACSECDKLFTDAKGKTETTAEELVIAKLAADKGDDKTDDNNTETKPDGDKSDESPKTGEAVATVALAVVALMGAAFVIIRKVKKA